MNYSINIAHNGIHWGLVELGCCGLEAAKSRLHALRIRFLEEDGFSLTLSRRDIVSHRIEA